MLNYKGDNYQKLRQLYEERFIVEGWQPFHPPITKPSKSRINNLSLNHVDSKDRKVGHKTLDKLKQTASQHIKASFLRNKASNPKSQITITCQQSEETAKSREKEDPEQNHMTERSNPFTSQLKKRKWIYDDNGLDCKKKLAKTFLVKRKEEDRHLPKRSTIIQLIQELRSEKRAQKQEKCQKSLPKQQNASLDVKNCVMDRKQQKMLFLVRKKNLKPYIQKSKTHRENTKQGFEQQTKIEGWHVLQHQF